MKNNKNAVVLLIIGLSTLIISVFGATFAYFSARNIDRVDASTVDVRTEINESSQFFALFDKTDVSFNISLIDMLDKEHGGTNGNSNKNVDVNLDVSLVGFNSDIVTTCDFDIVYTWAGEGNNYGTTQNPEYYYYKKSAALTDEKEFTYTLNHNGEDGTSVGFESVLVPKDAINNPQKLVLNGDNKLTINDANRDGITAVNDQYNIEFSFNNYNLLKQDEQKERIFEGILSIENIECKYDKKS